ncbi:MAG: phosphoribosylformylglycinamidine synthase subunit PurQ [Rhabdochlamydiaceae bacterium]|jgi:phosphoribosylformylglycinamidine synthase I
MRAVRTLVLSGYGINCEKEMAKAALLAGSEVVTAHVKTWILGQIDLTHFDILFFPGGFSFGDELGAAKVFANKIVFAKGKKEGKSLSEELDDFVKRGNCILGVCNGFQLLVKLGILPGFQKKQEVSLSRNERYQFESRWVHLHITPSRSIFTEGLKELYLPVRHAEGNFVVKEGGMIDRLVANRQIALQYGAIDGKVADHYPDNPNGSSHSIAGICDGTGRVLGMMPHPEAAIFFTHFPDWIRRKEELKRQGLSIPLHGPGLNLFKNVVNYSRQK